MTKDNRGRCFVIMPFTETSSDHTGEYWAKHYNDFLRPLIESHQLVAHRSSPLRGDILHQIITDLVTSFLVISDLTDANPNVYWELGVRQSFKHGTITIAENGTELPFDLGVKGTLFYHPDDHLKMSEFRSQLHDAINDCLSNPYSPDSHVLETISGRGSLFQILLKEESLRKLDAVLSEINYNLSVIEDITKCCKDNKKLREESKEEECEVDTGRNRTISVESLVVTRYLDADDRFYKDAEEYYSECNEFSQQLNSWDMLFGSDTTTEEWILENYSDIRKICNRFKKLVSKQRRILMLSL